MKKLILILTLFCAAASASAQFQTTDSLRKYVNKWIRNSAVDAFTNLRLNTAMQGLTRFVDSAYGGQVKSFTYSSDTFRLVTLDNDTFKIALPASAGNTNAGAGFRVIIPSTQAAKTIFQSFGLVIDSTTNANGLTFKPDTSVLQVREMDVFLIAGQSNGQGYGNSSLAPTTVPNTVYQFYQGQFTAGNDPVGNANTGSAWPSFGITWYAQTGRKICFVPSAFSGTSMASAANTGQGTWDVGGTLFDTAIARLNAAMAYLIANGYKPVFKGILWCQGENDAIAINGATITQATYQSAFQGMITRFKNSLGRRTPFYIFRTATQTAASDLGYDSVRTVQQNTVNPDSLIYIVYTNSLYFPSRSLFSDQYHYSQAGLNEMGAEGAQRIAGENFNIAAYQAGNRYNDYGFQGFGKNSGIPTAPIDVRGNTTSSLAMLVRGWAGFGSITSPSFPVHTDSLGVGTALSFARRGLSLTPSITSTSFLTFYSTNNLTIFQGTGTGSPEIRGVGRDDLTQNTYSLLINGFNYNAASGRKQHLLISTSGFGTNGANPTYAAGNIILQPGTYIGNGDSTQYKSDSVQVRLNRGGGAFHVMGKTHLDGIFRLASPPTGGADSVLVWSATDSTVKKIAQSALSGGSAALTNTYVGYGSGGVLSGSSALTYDGTYFKQEGSGATLGTVSTDALGASSGGKVFAAVKALPTASGNQLGAIDFVTRNGANDYYPTAQIAAVAAGAHTAGSNMPTDLLFRTQNTSSLTEKMRIKASGNVGIGVSNPLAKLHLTASGGNSAQAMKFTLSGASISTTIQSGAWEPASDGKLFYSIADGAGNRRQIVYTDSVGAVGAGKVPVGNGTDYTASDLFTFATITTTSTLSLAVSTKMVTAKVDATGGNVTVTLTANHTGQVVNIIKTNSGNSVTIAASSGSLLGGSTSLSTQYDKATFQWDGTNWYSIN